MSGSQFITPLDCRKLDGQQKEGRALWRLLAPLSYRSQLLGALITVPAGFITDFASVPRLPLTYLLAGDKAHEAAVVHDYLYTTHAVDGQAVTRAQADAVFREAISALKVRAPGFLMWLAVRVGGAGAWKAEGPEQTPEVQSLIEMDRAA